MKHFTKAEPAGASVLAVAVLSSFAATRANGDPADAAMAEIRPEAIRANMRFLADDLLEGRRTGTRGHELAAKFVAAQFEQLGLAPAGDNGTYFQEVPMRSADADETKAELSFVRGGKAEALVLGRDFLVYADPGRADTSVEAPVLYVGSGVTAPELKHDDYAGVDAKGKIVAMLAIAPSGFESSMRAHYSSTDVRAANAVAHGAVGLIFIDDPSFEKLYSFERRSRDVRFPHLHWLDAAGHPDSYYPELKGSASLSMDATARLFAGSRHTPAQVYVASDASKSLSFDLPVTARIRTVTRSEDTRSQNIAARLEGSDPKLKNEYVVYTAHVDHMGIGEPVKDDTIYNGALDNASGTSIVIELARAFAGMSPRPKRSILFVAVTGEEEGLLGSDYFARYPTVPKDAIVANVNIDEDVMLWPLQDVIAFGADHSSLGAVADAAARRLGLKVSPDPIPEQVVFIRSDQYSFVKQGIPALFPVPGFASSDSKIKPEELMNAWEATVYHQPQDDMSQTLDWDAAVAFARYNFLCGYLVAQAPERPAWNKGDFFGDHYGKKAADR